MNRRIATAVALALGLLAAVNAPAVPLDSPFSYQGNLKIGGVPATGNYDFEFRLFDASTGGNQVGSTTLRSNIPVSDGLFSATLDFNDVFDGNRLFLEIAVRPSGSGGAYTTLSGRVQLLGVPFAQHAIDADKVDGLHASSFSLSSHTHQLSDLPGAVMDNQVPNDITVNMAQDSQQLDGNDSTAFSLVDHTHHVVHGVPGSAYEGNPVLEAGTLGEVLVIGEIRAMSDDAPGTLSLSGGNSQNDSLPGGGEVRIEGGRGVDSASGGAGGDVGISGGDADGESANKGGDVNLAGGSGVNGGPNGTVFINGKSEAGNVKIYALRDSTESFGSFGQSLLTSGAGVLWGWPTGLGSPDGDPEFALYTDDDANTLFFGDILLESGERIRNDVDGRIALESESNGNAVTFDGVSMGNPALEYLAPGDGSFRIQPVAAGAGEDGDDLALYAGDASDTGTTDGGEVTIRGGNAGGGGTGVAGRVALLGGDAEGSAASKGGNIDLLAGSGTGAGAHPGGDINLSPGAGTNGAASGAVYANSKLVARSVSQTSSITLDPTTAANPQITFAAGTGATGKMTIAAPDAPLSNTDGRDIELIAGDGVIAGVGNGGDVLVRAGNGAGLSGGVGGDGGSVTITAGNGDSDSNAQDGGNINLNAGFAQGGGTAGIVQTNARLAVLRTSAAHPIHVGTSGSNGNGAHLTTGGIWTNGSDVNSKTEFEEIDPKAILAKVLALPVTKWQYKGEPEGVRHIGPMAQDFMEAFHLGESERHIGTVDADGVALSAIKGLHQKTREEFDSLRAENAELRTRNQELEERLARLEESMQVMLQKEN